MSERLTEAELAEIDAFEGTPCDCPRLVDEVRRLRGIIDSATRRNDEDRHAGEIDLWHEGRAIREEQEPVKWGPAVLVAEQPIREEQG